MSEQDGTTPDGPDTETADTSQEAPGAPETAQGEQGDPKTRKGDKDAVLADLAKERRERQKLQNELKKLQERDLSELEKAQRQAADATKQLEELQRESLRQRVALKAGIPAEHIHRLQGSTEDELAADAAELAKLLTPKAPRPDPTQGSRAGQQPTDMNALLRQAAGLR
jgi:vacuolar-type H+-ATPase subunit I/STV1